MALPPNAKRPKTDCFFNCTGELLVEDVRFPVCMEELSKASEFFRGLFGDDFRERESKEFRIEEESAEDIHTMLCALNPDRELNRITGKHLYSLLPRTVRRITVIFGAVLRIS